MRRAGRWGTAAVFVLWLAGCSEPEFFADYFGLSLFQSTVTGKDRVVAGSLEAVSQSTQNTLRQLGLAVVVTPVGADVRIASQTGGGDRFALVLTRVKTDKGESTRVRFEWEERVDEQTSLQILSQLEAHTDKAGAQK